MKVALVPPDSRRGKLSREFVEEHQRRRIVGPVAEVAHELGIDAVTAARICQSAKMSRTVFYALFETSAGGLRYSFEEAFSQIVGPVQSATEGVEPWLERVNAGLGAFYGGIAKEPFLAELCLVHSAKRTGEAPAHYYEATVDFVIGLIAGGRVAGMAAIGAGYRDPGPLTEEYLARTIVSLAAMRLRQDLAKQLPEHRDEMTLLVANAFLGSEEASRAWRTLESGRKD